VYMCHSVCVYVLLCLFCLWTFSKEWLLCTAPLKRSRPRAPRPPPPSGSTPWRSPVPGLSSSSLPSSSSVSCLVATCTSCAFNVSLCCVGAMDSDLLIASLNRVLEKVEPACKACTISRFESGIVPLFGCIDELLGVDVFLSFRFSLCFISFHLSLGGSCGRQCVQLSGVGPPSGCAEDSDASIQGVRAREERYGRVRCRVSTIDSRILRVCWLFFQRAHLRRGKRACTF
jgi:hypothetical protein